MTSLLFVAFVNNTFASDCPGDEMVNGWCWPTGTNSIGTYIGYDDSNPDFNNRRHLAQDIDASEGSDVYAIANGRVIHARSDIGFYGGATCSGSSIDGAGVIIQHTTSTGENFVALYAHLKNVNVSDIVVVGQKIGEVRSYTWCRSRNDHLHFGIRYPENDDDNRWSGYENSDGNHYGFIDPITFLNTHSPLQKPTTQTICGQPTCNIDSQTFSNGDVVGWYPKGNCNEAQQWFGIGEVDGVLQPIQSLPLGEVCICR